MPYPIPLEYFKNASPAVIKGLPSGVPLILSIGRLERRKGMDTLVKAMTVVWKSFPDAHLLLLGKETEFSIQKLREMVPRDKGGNIIYPGFVHYSEIPSYYKAATVYVSACQYETFGYTLLESMASGTPVICTDRGAMPELIEHEKNGIVTSYGDPNELGMAIIQMLSSEEKRMYYAVAGFKKAAQYDMEIIGQRMLKEYQEVVND